MISRRWLQPSGLVCIARVDKDDRIAREYLAMPVSDDDLIEMIADEALIDRALLTRDATLSDVGLDSVGVVSVIFAVEEKYGVEIPEDAFTETTKAIIAKKA